MKRKLSFVLALVLALGVALPMSSASAAVFSDVNRGDWFYEYVTTLSDWGIINGYKDGTFKPDNTITRGEFIKMLAIVAELYTTTKPKGVHWAEEYWNMLNEALVLEITETDANGRQTARPLIPLTWNALEQNINRYEMAFLINRVLYMVYYENQMGLKTTGDSIANHIADYSTMNKGYQGSVEQVYMKGILTGYEDTSFQGDNTLSRAEAATSILRLLYPKYRITQPYAVAKEPLAVDPSFTSFAFQYRTMTDAQRRQALFGNPSKTYFASSTEAAPYMTSVSIKIWQLNEQTGVKTSATVSLTVHKLVAQEVKAIFDDIYNSPEKFPIKSIGGARFTDTLRHSWGCAIDINPNENYYINYNTGQTVGSFCWKNGSSPYCITPESSVVKAFAKYGWGWGGQGWSTAADYMHFSILASGG